MSRGRTDAGSFRRGSALYQLLGRVSRINTSFAGNLDSVLAELLRTGDTRLGEPTSKSLCMGLLHRLRCYGELALGCSPTHLFGPPLPFRCVTRMVR